LIVISAGQSMKKNGYLARLEEQLQKADITHVLYDKIQPNPLKEHVMEGAALAKAQKCDFVIGLGGGSSIDSAKAIAVMATNDGDYWDYISGGTGKGKPVPNSPLPIIAITTTAGTGTEADPWTVITNGEEKIGFGYDETFPLLSIVDPDLMTSVPSRLTAYQGFDALFHSTEGYLNNTANEMSDLFALKSIALIGRSLVKAVTDGSNEEARADVALANTLAGIVESTSGCISEHSIEHAMSAYHYSLPHGAGLIMISVAYYTFLANSGSCSERLIDMAKALGNPNADKPMDFVAALQALQKACGVDQLKMSDYGIQRDEISKIAENAYITMGGLYQVDPCTIAKEDTIQILEQSYR
ncbi:MAG: iron-containing alcohol dehydrogenase, partial [Eubacteriales bacterium]|nr:iron-containing alcohol dehydrogenase [Eubacteriales bacterium]